MTPPKRRRTFTTAPTSTAEPAYTLLKDLKPELRASVNVKGRISFVSLGGTTPRGDDIVKIEIADGTTKSPVHFTALGKNNVAAVKDLQVNQAVKLQNLRCTEYNHEASLIVGDKDSFRISIIKEGAHENGQIPDIEPPAITPMKDIGPEHTGTVTLLVRVEQALEQSLLVTDHQGTAGTVHLGDATQAHSFTNGSTLCLHRVAVWKGRATLWPSGGVEPVAEEDFLEVTPEAADTARAE